MITPSFTWDLILAILQYGLIPLMLWLWKKQTTRVELLETRIAQVEKSVAVIEVMVDNIRDDIKDIKYGIDKLMSR